MIQRQTTFSLHNNSPSQRNCKLFCHNNWAIMPDSTTIERGREIDMKWTRLLSWKHLIDVHQNLVFEMGKNRWGARVTGNRCKQQRSKLRAKQQEQESQQQMMKAMMIQQQQLNIAFLNVVKSYLQCISDQLSKCFYLIKTGCCCCCCCCIRFA